MKAPESLTTVHIEEIVEGKKRLLKMVKTIPQVGDRPSQRILYGPVDPPFTWSEWTIVDFGSRVWEFTSTPNLLPYENDSIVVWDQPNGQGNTIGFTGFGWADLAAYGWAGRVRSYLGNNIQGSFVGGNPVRHEEFGLNGNIVNAGHYAQIATHLNIRWHAMNYPLVKAGTILSEMIQDWELYPYPHMGCLSLPPDWSTANGAPIVLANVGEPAGTADANQKWQYDPQTAHLVNVASGKCIQVSSTPSPSGLGQLLELWQPTGEANQQWGYDPQRHSWYNLGSNLSINVYFVTQLEARPIVPGAPSWMWWNYFY